MAVRSNRHHHDGGVDAGTKSDFKTDEYAGRNFRRNQGLLRRTVCRNLVTFAYNMLAGMLRALGDSKTPVDVSGNRIDFKYCV